MTTIVPEDAVAAHDADFNALVSGGNQAAARMRSAIFGWLYLLSPLRILFPVITVRNVTYVLGYDDVRAVLSDSGAFSTPFRKVMADLDKNGTVSVLGFEDESNVASQKAANDQAYARNLCQIMRCLSLNDLPSLARDTADNAEQIVRGAKELDVVGGLLIPVVLDVVQKYFGLTFARPPQFHRWAMALSNYTFGGKPSDTSLRQAAKLAGTLVDGELDRAIASARKTVVPSNTLLGRFASMRPGAGVDALTDDELRATVAGLLTGMLPNIPIAGFNVLQVLLHKPRAMAAAQAAAAANDDDLLQRCIVEALRFRPIDLGRKRVCVADNGSAVGQHGWQRGPIPAGRRVFAATLPAMFDGRRVRKPFRFDPSRPLSDNLAFGAGRHSCVGGPIALCVLTHMLKPLLRRTRIRRKAGAPPSTFFLGFFPESFTLELG